MFKSRSTVSTLCAALAMQACVTCAAADLSQAGDAQDKALIVRPVPTLPPIYFTYTLPGAFAFKTTRGYYLTAVSGGGRSTPPAVVTATQIPGAWEQFRIRVDPSTAYDKSFQTSMGNFVTAVNGGGMTGDALHTDATRVLGWEQFRMIDLAENGGSAPTWYSIFTVNNNVVTAVGAGGRYDDAIHTDGYLVGSWERLRPVKCGDLGDGYEYYILDATGTMLTAEGGGGHADDYAIVRGWAPGEPSNAQWSRFRLMRQSDGTYALKTSNGVNYVTALQGGGLVQQYLECDPGWFGACIDGMTGIFHTDATAVRSWEKFRIVDTGDCKYAIQTSSGFYTGIFSSSHGTMLTTRRSSITSNEKFEFVMSGLGSPVIIH